MRSRGLAADVGEAADPFLHRPGALRQERLDHADPPEVVGVLEADAAPAAGEDDDVDRVSVVEAFLPEGTGTMKEGVSGIPKVGGEPAGSHPKGTTRPEVAAGAGEGRRRGEDGDWEGGW